MDKILSSLKGMLADSSDANMLSSKRVISFLAFLAVVVSYFIDQFSVYKVTPELFNAMMWIVIGGLGITGVEKFAPKK
jgi:RAB protein geranylgeranyltransferase component A